MDFREGYGENLIVEKMRISMMKTRLVRVFFTIQ